MLKIIQDICINFNHWFIKFIITTSLNKFNSQQNKYLPDNLVGNINNNRILNIANIPWIGWQWILLRRS